jgi:tetratricopeptide (TPR) repeat protein
MYTVSQQRNYAFGWEVNQLSAYKYGKPLTQVQHGGGIDGFNAFISRILEDQLLIVILNNTGGAPLTPMTKGLTNIVYGKSYEVATENVDSMLFQAIKSGGISELNKKYAELVSSGDTPRERSINYFGYELLEMKMIKEAIAVFKLNVQTNPDSANAHDSLAEAYLADGNIAKSLEFYQQTLELDPTSENASQAIKTLSSKL